MSQTRFVDLAMSIGVATQIAGLLRECDAALLHLADAQDRRWAWRLEAQRRLLLKPTLRVLVALSTRLVEENPKLSPFVAPAIADLARQNPDFTPYHARAIAPEGAFITARQAAELDIGARTRSGPCGLNT